MYRYWWDTNLVCFFDVPRCLHALPEIEFCMDAVKLVKELNWICNAPVYLS